MTVLFSSHFHHFSGCFAARHISVQMTPRLDAALILAVSLCLLALRIMVQCV